MIRLWVAVCAGGSLQYLGFAAPTTNTVEAVRMVREYVAATGVAVTVEKGVEPLDAWPVVDLGQWMRARVTRPDVERAV